MMKIEISQETIEALMRDVLIQDYRWLRETLYDLVNRGVEEGKLGEHHIEDYQFNKRIFEALKIVMEFYLADHEREVILAE